MLDIDPQHGGEETLDGLEAKHGKLPHTPMALTGGGGQHHLFVCPPGFGNTVARFGPGTDTRGERGYIVAPPSKHISGGTYEWELSSDPANVALAPMPKWLGGQNGHAHHSQHHKTLPSDGADSVEPYPRHQRRPRPPLLSNL